MLGRDEGASARPPRPARGDGAAAAGVTRAAGHAPLLAGLRGTGQTGLPTGHNSGAHGTARLAVGPPPARTSPHLRAVPSHGLPERALGPAGTAGRGDGAVPCSGGVGPGRPAGRAGGLPSHPRSRCRTGALARGAPARSKTHPFPSCTTSRDIISPASDPKQGQEYRVRSHVRKHGRVPRTPSQQSCYPPPRGSAARGWESPTQRADGDGGLREGRALL